MDQPSPSLLDPAYIAPAAVAFVIGLLAGALIVNLIAGVAIGLTLAISAVGRRYAAARMQARIDEQVREHEGHR
jgi:type IV secretory pathway TrbD component